MRRVALALALVTLGCQAEIGAGLGEAQAGQMVLALDEAGIGARSERDGRSERFRVVVPNEDVPRALAVLRERELPRDEEPSLSSLFERSGLIPSASEERARREAALGAELARSLEAMDGVVRARVHLALPDPLSRPLDDDAPGARAAVLLIGRPGARIDEGAARTLVSGAVGELAARDVTIVTSETRAPLARQPTLIWVGPIAVSRGTATVLKAVLAGSFALNLILAVVLVVSRRRAAMAASDSTNVIE